MLKRTVPLLVLAALVAPGIAARADCGSAVLHNTLSLNSGEITITIHEVSPPTDAAFVVPPEAAPVPNSGCDDGTMTKTTPDGYLAITEGDDELCRNDAVDPSFDPFYFGGGLNDLTGDCGAKFSAASIPNPLLPDAAGSYAGPDGAYVGTTRQVVTDVAGSYKVGGQTFVLPQDTTGLSVRGILVERS